jgi:hypothetical protein
MKTKLTLRTLALVAMLLSVINPQFSTWAQGTAFTYQGRLSDHGAFASGSYDLQFSLWNAPSGPSQLGGAITNAATAVSNGLFSVTLDFGANFPGQDRWLEIDARTNAGGAWSALSPRQKLTPSPYAITAGTVSGGIAAGQLTGAISLAQLPAAVVTNGANGVSITGTFTGNGAGVTNLNLPLSSSGAITPNSALFSLASMPAVDYPGTLVAADVNGDGRVDLITPMTVSTYVQVLTNDVRGRFSIASIVGAAGHPRTVVAADINGGGRIDLISADSDPNVITISTNDGRGGFSQLASLAIGGGPVAIVAAEVNGDGRMDLITANYDNTLSVVFNGPGGFILASSPAVGSGPLSVAAADVNGDGKVDLISANYYDNTLSVLTNNGFGFFTLATNLAVGLNPQFVVAADVNGDGKVDLISANSGTNTLSVLTNDGSGRFVLAATLTVGLGPVSVAAADVNGDGWADLISANNLDHTLSVLTNNHSGGFALAALLDVGAEYSPLSVTTADVNGDGRVDIISANFGGASGSKLAVFLNTAFNFVGNFSGNFNGPLDAANVLTGTLPDARLSDNVALLNKRQDFYFPKTFSSDVGFTANVGIGTTNPTEQLTIANVTSYNNGLKLTGSSNGGTGMAIENTSSGGHKFDLLSGGASDGIGVGGFGIFDETVNLYRIAVTSGGNVGIGVFAPTQKLQVNGNILASGTITPNSDRSMKTGFAPVDTAAVLDKVARLPIQQWRFKAEPDDVKHFGPMAQDFRAAFGLGEIPTAIATVDADGVALAAIQGLNQKVEEKEARIKELEDRLERLERLVNQKSEGVR